MEVLESRHVAGHMGGEVGGGLNVDPKHLQDVHESHHGMVVLELASVLEHLEILIDNLVDVRLVVVEAIRCNEFGSSRGVCFRVW